MKECEIFCLLEKLSKLGAMKKFILIKTSEFGGMLGISQQTSSRKLSRLEKDGYIKRVISKSGTRVKITDQGIKFLENEIKTMKIIEEYFYPLSFTGKLITGMGEGSYYMSRPGYIEQFQKLFNEKPYPGTFNVEVDDETMERLSYLKENAKYKLLGFVDNDRTFGNVSIHRARVNGINAYVIFPERGHYKNVVEIVSSVNLRKALNLVDGNVVTVEVFPEII